MSIERRELAEWVLSKMGELGKRRVDLEKKMALGEKLGLKDEDIGTLEPYLLGVVNRQMILEDLIERFKLASPETVKKAVRGIED